MIRVYTASKTCHAQRWLELSAEWTEVQFVARWPALVGKSGNPIEPSWLAKIYWQHDLEDVRKADVVLCYAEPREHLRGALVEAGAALACGKDVIVVGEHTDYGTWQHHPKVHRVPTLEDARALLGLMSEPKYRLGETVRIRMPKWNPFSED